MTELRNAAEIPPGAVRLIFEYDGDEVRLLSQQRVDVAVTGFDLAVRPKPGHYIEVRDEEGTVLTRVAARGAFPSSAEVFTDDPDEPIRRVDVERPSGAFTVVVPVPPAARDVAVVRIAQPLPNVQVPPGGTSVALGAVEVAELAEFSLEPGD